MPWPSPPVMYTSEYTPWDVKFQYNNLVKYNSQYSVCVAISQGLNKFFLDLLFISLLIRTLFNILT